MDNATRQLLVTFLEMEHGYGWNRRDFERWCAKNDLDFHELTVAHYSTTVTYGAIAAQYILKKMSEVTNES